MRIHISLPATDLEQSAVFYEKLFGRPVSKRRPDYLNFRLDQPPIHLALVKKTTEPARPGGHFGIELADAESLADWQTRLQLSRLDYEPEPGAQCCYATGDKLWLTDPDGYRWEIWHRTGEFDALKETSGDQVKEIATETRCCG